MLSFRTLLCSSLLLVTVLQASFNHPVIEVQVGNTTDGDGSCPWAETDDEYTKDPDCSAERYAYVIPNDTGGGFLSKVMGF